MVVIIELVISAALCACVMLQMFDWISHNKEVFLQSHTEIGRSYQHAVELQTQHNHFAMNSMVSEAFAVSGRASTAQLSLTVTQLKCDGRTYQSSTLEKCRTLIDREPTLRVPGRGNQGV